MKRNLLLFILLFVCSCAHRSVIQPDLVKDPPPPAVPDQPNITVDFQSQSPTIPDQPTVMEKLPLPLEIPTQISDQTIVKPGEAISPLFGDILSNISVSKSSFNPSLKEEIAIHYELSRAAKVTAHVYDPDQGLVKTITKEQSEDAGKKTLIWDGKDLDGKIVPDEAYFFTILAEDDNGSEEVYDPTTFSGGVEHDITTAEIHRQEKTIMYQMPEMGRVMIRGGIQGGPLMNTIVDWKPRVKGRITEYWNGKDQDNLMDLRNHPKFKLIITYFTLPENSIIAYGNKKSSYQTYKRLMTLERPRKKERPGSVAKVSPHYKLERLKDYAPKVTMEFTNAESEASNGTIVLKDKALVKVEIDEKDKKLFLNQQFEIVFFLNGEFYAEDEAGYTPFNWVWDLSKVEAGEHLFTVNLSSFTDQIGIQSRKVKVVK